MLTNPPDRTSRAPEPPHTTQARNGTLQDPHGAQARRQHRTQRNGQGEQENHHPEILALGLTNRGYIRFKSTGTYKKTNNSTELNIIKNRPFITRRK